MMTGSSCGWGPVLVVLVVILAASPALAGEDVSAEQLRIGWASADMTPNQPVVIGGMANARIAPGAQDPVTATALAIESSRGGKPGGVVIMVSCDLLFIADTLRDRVRDLVKQSLPDIDPGGLVLNATHTHNPPETYTDPDLVRKLSRFGLEVPAPGRPGASIWASCRRRNTWSSPPNG